MANYTRQFEVTSREGGGFITNILVTPHPDTPNNSTRGIIQVQHLDGSITLQGRLDPKAPWIDLKTWTTSAMEEVVLANQLRLVASHNFNAWLGETR